VALAVLYAGTLVVTMQWSGRGVLPLYDGFAPPPRYQWVEPPPEFVTGNEVPHPKRTEVKLGAGGSSSQSVAGDDSQLTVDLAAGAVPPAPPSTRVAVTVTPLGPSGLGPLPGGVAPDGNAFRVEVAYLPAGPPLASLAVPATAAVKVPLTADKVFASPDGKAWTELEVVKVESDRTTFRMPAPGYVLPSVSPFPLPHVVPKARTAPTVLVAGGTVVAVCLLFLGPVAVRHLLRRRRPQP